MDKGKDGWMDGVVITIMYFFMCEKNFKLSSHSLLMLPKYKIHLITICRNF